MGLACQHRFVVTCTGLLCSLLALVVSAPALDYTCASPCEPPGCICPSTNGPGGLAVEDTPQMVLISFDDAVYQHLSRFDTTAELRARKGQALLGEKHIEAQSDGRWRDDELVRDHQMRDFTCPLDLIITSTIARSKRLSSKISGATRLLKSVRPSSM